MRVDFLTNTLTATPIRPLFKGALTVQKSSECGNNSVDKINFKNQSINNKNVFKDIFEKTSVK